MRSWMSLKMKVQAGIDTTCGSSQAEGGALRTLNTHSGGPLAITLGHQVVRVTARQNHFLMMLSLIKRAS